MTFVYPPMRNLPSVVSGHPGSVGKATPLDWATLGVTLVGAGVGWRMGGLLSFIGFGSSYVGFVTKAATAAAGGYLGYVGAHKLWKVPM